MPTFIDVFEVLVWCIDTLADHYRRVFIPCVTGNHGRNTHKIRAKGRNFTNFDWLLYQMLTRHFERDNRIRFSILDGPDCLYKIYGHRYLLTHGDQFRGDDGMIGALGPLCVTPDTPVLLSDLSYVLAEDLRVGDELVGFDDYASRGERRLFKPSIVTACERKQLECIEIETADGLKTIASLDHPWLTRSGMAHSWSLTKNLHLGSRILSLGAPWTREETWEAGYLAGVLDGEGSIKDGGHNSRVKFTQQKNALLDRTLAILNSRDIPYKLRENGAAARGYEPCYGVQLFGQDGKSGYSILNLIGAVRPPRLLHEQSRQIWNGRSVQIARDVRVVGLRFVGWREVAAFSTSTSTFIANGMLTHNTRGDHKKRWGCERVQSLNSCPSPC